MIEYCLITYLTCVDTTCVLKFAKLPHPQNVVTKNNATHPFTFAADFPQITSTIMANAIPYASKPACAQAGKHDFFGTDSLGGVKHSFTCYGVNLKPNYNCFGQQINDKYRINMGSMELQINSEAIERKHENT